MYVYMIYLLMLSLYVHFVNYFIHIKLLFCFIKFNNVLDKG